MFVLLPYSSLFVVLICEPPITTPQHLLTPSSAVYRSLVNTPIWRRTSNPQQSWSSWINCFTWRTPAVKPRAGSWWRWPSSATARLVFLWHRGWRKRTAAPWTQCWDSGLRSCSASAKILNFEPKCYLEMPTWNPWRWHANTKCCQFDWQCSQKLLQYKMMWLHSRCICGSSSLAASGGWK